VGKALFVYWPGGYEFPWPRGLKTFLARNSGRNKLLWTMNVLVRLRWIPNISRMRFIYGGSGKNYKDTSLTIDSTTGLGRRTAKSPFFPGQAEQ